MYFENLLGGVCEVAGGFPASRVHRPAHARVSRVAPENLADMADSLAEGGVFELPVPICEQSDDSIRLSFATSRRTAKRYRPAAHFLARARVVAWSDHLLLLQFRSVKPAELYD